MDVKEAYLNGILQEKVYMKQPEGFGDGTEKVCLLQKTLYGLKQSGWEWNKELDWRLKDIGFENLRSDPCAYIHQDGAIIRMITVWVDDLLLFASTTMVMKNLKKELESVFDLTDFGEPSKIVGIEISRMNETLIILQGQYIDMILQKYNMQDANPVSMPLNTNTKLKHNKENNEPNCSNNYVSLIVSLQYLVVTMCPDIAYSINCLAAYTANPALEHYSAVKWLLRYLKGTQNLGITYK